MRFTPEVLPIVCVLALIALVAANLVIERTPDRFEVEHVEVVILFHTVEEVNREFVLAMRKSAQIAKVTALLRALRAELGLVLLRVVERLNPVVSLGAERPLRALVSLCILAHLRRVGAKGTPLILLMVIEALFLIVTSLASARLGLEKSKIE